MAGSETDLGSDPSSAWGTSSQHLWTLQFRPYVSPSLAQGSFQGLCEVKLSPKTFFPFSLTLSGAGWSFPEATQTDKDVSILMSTRNGLLLENEHF